MTFTRILRRLPAAGGCVAVVAIAAAAVSAVASGPTASVGTTESVSVIAIPGEDFSLLAEDSSYPAGSVRFVSVHVTNPQSASVTYSVVYRNRNGRLATLRRGSLARSATKVLSVPKASYGLLREDAIFVRSARPVAVAAYAEWRSTRQRQSGDSVATENTNFVMPLVVDRVDEVRAPFNRLR